MNFIPKGVSMLRNGTLGVRCTSTAVRGQENQAMWSFVVTWLDGFQYLNSLIYKHIECLRFTAACSINYSEKTKCRGIAAVHTELRSIKRLFFYFNRIYRLLFRMVQNQYIHCFIRDWPAYDLFFSSKYTELFPSTGTVQCSHGTHNVCLTSLEISHVLPSPTAISSPHPYSCSLSCSFFLLYPAYILSSLTCLHQLSPISNKGKKRKLKFSVPGNTMTLASCCLCSMTCFSSPLLDTCLPVPHREGTSSWQGRL